MDNTFAVVRAVKKMDKMIKLMKFVNNNYVLVGVPQKKVKRKEESITNAELMYIHSKGSPKNNIPARPSIEPAIEDSKKEISKLLSKAASLYVSEGESEAINALKIAGMKGQNASRAWFTNPDNGWEPNSPAVANAKKKKKSTEPKPLIDTGQLRKSITYVVVKDGEMLND